MDDVDELLDNKSSTDKPEVPNKEELPGGVEGDVWEDAGGAKYNMADPEQRKRAAQAFRSMEVERNRLINENKKLKETTPDRKPEKTTDNSGLPDSEKPRVKEVFNKELGFVTKEDLDVRDYLKDATKEANRLAKEYEINPDDLFKEMVDLNRRVPVEKFELLLKLTHPEKYEEKRKAAIAADKPATPYTERPAKSGVEIPKAEGISFRKNNIVSRALEEIGAKE